MSEALVKIIEARAAEVGLPGSFPDNLTALDNQHGLTVSMARVIAIEKALHIQQSLLKKTNVKRIKLTEPGKGIVSAAASQALLSPDSAGGLTLTRKVQTLGPQKTVEQLFCMDAPEPTGHTRIITNSVFNKEQVAAEMDISKADVTFAQQLSRASGVSGAVCPERGPILREMQMGLSEAIDDKADTFSEGTALRIATWSSRAYSASLYVFPAVEVPHNLREAVRTGAIAGLHPLAIAMQLAKKLDIWDGLLRYEGDASKAHAPMGPVEAQHFVQGCLEKFLGPLWDAATVLDREGQGSGRRITFRLGQMRDQRLPESFIQEVFTRHFLEVEKSTLAFINGLGSTHRRLGDFSSKLQKEVDDFITAAKAAHNHSRYLQQMGIVAAGPAQTEARPIVEAITPEREKRTSPGMEQRAKKTARTQSVENDPSMGAWIAALQAVSKVRFGTAPTDRGKRACANMMRFGSCSNTECNYSHNLEFWAAHSISKDTVGQKARELAAERANSSRAGSTSAQLAQAPASTFQDGRSRSGSRESS